MGGENDTFNAARKALDILTDPQARKMYDEFGIVPGEAASEIKLKAMEELAQLFISIIEQVTPENLSTVDFLGTLRAAVTNRQRKIDEQLQGLAVEEAKLVSYQNVVQKRMKRASGGKDIFADVLATLLSRTSAARYAIEAEAKVAQAMLEELANYSFDVERVFRQQTSTVARTWTMTSSSGW